MRLAHGTKRRDSVGVGKALHRVTAPQHQPRPFDEPLVPPLLELDRCRTAAAGREHVDDFAVGSHTRKFFQSALHVLDQPSVQCVFVWTLRRVHHGGQLFGIACDQPTGFDQPPDVEAALSQRLADAPDVRLRRVNEHRFVFGQPPLQVVANVGNRVVAVLEEANRMRSCGRSLGVITGSYVHCPSIISSRLRTATTLCVWLNA